MCGFSTSFFIPLLAFGAYQAKRKRVQNPTKKKKNNNIPSPMKKKQQILQKTKTKKHHFRAHQSKGKWILFLSISLLFQMQGGSMPNTSSSVPFLLSSSMQSIRSRRPSACLSSGPLGSGSGLLQQLGSGMVRQLNFGSGTASPVHHAYNGNAAGPAGVRFNYVRKCPSLNITFSN